MQKVVLFSGVPHTPRDKLNEAILLIAFGNRFEDRSMTREKIFIMLYALGLVVAALVTAREDGSEPSRLSAEVLWQLERGGGPGKTLAEMTEALEVEKEYKVAAQVWTETEKAASTP